VKLICSILVLCLTSCYSYITYYEPEVYIDGAYIVILVDSECIYLEPPYERYEIIMDSINNFE
jgi:hypothetical protein